MKRHGAPRIASGAFAFLLAVSSAPAGADVLCDDKATLSACLAAAFPEGDLLAAGGSPKSLGDCIGLIMQSKEPPCGESGACYARETAAWLSLAREVDLEHLPARNKALIKSFVANIEKQARALCTASAARAAWGRDRVAKGRYRVEADSSCLRDAVAGMAAPLLGNMNGN